MSAVMTQSDSECMPAPKHPGGRPSKYNTRTVRKAREYIQGKYKTIPTIAGLCVYLGVARNTLYEWLKDESKIELQDTIALMPELREELLLEGSLKGKLNSNISKLVLMTNHGYSENNQRDTGITVNVNRSAAITEKDGTLTIDVED